MEVLRFEPSAGQEVQLVARWAVIESGNKNPVAVKESRVARQTTTKSTEASVAALSAALGDLSREISDTIGGITRHPRKSESSLDTADVWASTVAAPIEQ